MTIVELIVLHGWWLCFKPCHSENSSPRNLGMQHRGLSSDVGNTSLTSSEFVRPLGNFIYRLLPRLICVGSEI